MSKVKQRVKQDRKSYGAGDGIRTHDVLLGKQAIIYPITPSYFVPDAIPSSD